MNYECHIDKDLLIHRVAKELAGTDVSPYIFQHEFSAPRIFTTCVTICSDPGA